MEEGGFRAREKKIVPVKVDGGVYYLYAQIIRSKGKGEKLKVLTKKSSS